MRDALIGFWPFVLGIIALFGVIFLLEWIVDFLWSWPFEE